MPGQHTELAFEAAIEHHLLTQAGHTAGDRESFSPEIGIDPGEFLAFVHETQLDQWTYLKSFLGSTTEKTLLDDLCTALDSEYQGCLKVLRHGFKCLGKLIHVAYFAPASGMNPETQDLCCQSPYRNPTARIQLKHGNSLDMVLSLNGIPLSLRNSRTP